MIISKRQKMLIDNLLSYEIRLKEQTKAAEDAYKAYQAMQIVVGQIEHAYKAYQAMQIVVGQIEQRIVTAQKDLLDTFLNDHVKETILTGNETYPVCVIEKYNGTLKVLFPATTKLEVSDG